jgi:hypothetical protein
MAVRCYAICWINVHAILLHYVNERSSHHPKFHLENVPDIPELRMGGFIPADELITTLRVPRIIFLKRVSGYGKIHTPDHLFVFFHGTR